MKRRGSADGAAQSRRGRFGGPALAALVIIFGLAATLLIVGVLRDDQRENADRVMDQRTDVVRGAVQTETERYRALIEVTAAGLSTDETLTWEDFDTASAPLASAGLIGAVTVAYVVPSSTAAIPATQQLWRSRGAEGLVLRPDGSGEHYFTIFTRPLATSAPTLAGLDLSDSASASAAVTDARRLGQPTVSDTYVRLRDRTLPRPRQQQSFAFVAPIWSRAPEPVFRGWIVLGMRSQDFLSGVLRTVSQGQLDSELRTTNRDGSQATVAEYTVAGTPSLARQNDFPVADQQWTLITRADPRRLPGAHSTLPLAVLITGLAITMILAGLVHVLATGRSRAWDRVQEATAELREAEAESRRQAGLLGAIMFLFTLPAAVAAGASAGVPAPVPARAPGSVPAPVPANPPVVSAAAYVRPVVAVVAAPVAPAVAAVVPVVPAVAPVVPAVVPVVPAVASVVPAVAPAVAAAGEDDAVRAALARALAERADVENSRLPGQPAPPPADPPAHEAPVARLRASAPDRQHDG